MKRLFVAIKLSPNEDFLRIYYFLKRGLKNDTIKWVEPDNMHLTLKFLGETEQNEIPKIKALLTSFVIEKNSFQIEFDKTGIFGSKYNPKVIWFGINDNSQIKKFGENLLQYFNDNGFKTDRQNFVPHLSIGRIKKIENKNHFQSIINKVKNEKIQSFIINEIILYESILKPSGPTYINLGRYKLG